MDHACWLIDWLIDWWVFYGTLTQDQPIWAMLPGENWLWWLMRTMNITCDNQRQICLNCLTINIAYDRLHAWLLFWVESAQNNFEAIKITVIVLNNFIMLLLRELKSDLQCDQSLGIRYIGTICQNFWRILGGNF